MLGLDPSISILTLVIDFLSDISVHFAAADARVKPEHDVEKATTRQNEKCRTVTTPRTLPPRQRRGVACLATGRGQAGMRTRIDVMPWMRLE